MTSRVDLEHLVGLFMTKACCFFKHVSAGVFLHLTIFSDASLSCFTSDIAVAGFASSFDLIFSKVQKIKKEILGHHR